MSFTFYPSGDVFWNQPDFLTDIHSPVGIDGFCGRHCESVLGGSFHFRTLPLKLKMDLISIFFSPRKSRTRHPISLCLSVCRLKTGSRGGPPRGGHGVFLPLGPCSSAFLSPLHHSQVTCNSGAFLTQMLAFPALLRSCFPLGTEVETQFWP